MMSTKDSSGGSLLKMSNSGKAQNRLFLEVSFSTHHERINRAHPKSCKYTNHIPPRNLGKSQTKNNRFIDVPLTIFRASTVKRLCSTKK